MVFAFESMLARRSFEFTGEGLIFSLDVISMLCGFNPVGSLSSSFTPRESKEAIL